MGQRNRDVDTMRKTVDRILEIAKEYGWAAGGMSEDAEAELDALVGDVLARCEEADKAEKMLRRYEAVGMDEEMLVAYEAQVVS